MNLLSKPLRSAVVIAAVTLGNVISLTAIANAVRPLPLLVTAIIGVAQLMVFGALYYVWAEHPRRDDYPILYAGVIVLMPLSIATGLVWGRVRSPEQFTLMLVWTGALLYFWHGAFTTIVLEMEKRHGRASKPQEESMGLAPQGAASSNPQGTEPTL